jgi:hypothetical protein
MYQQRRLASTGVLPIQKHQLRTQVIQQADRRSMFADAIADPSAFVDALGKWAQFEADHGSFQPTAGRADDLIEACGFIVDDGFILINEPIPVQPR